MQKPGVQSERVFQPGSARDTGGRIKQLLEHYGLSAYQANEKLGYGRSSKLYKLLSNEVRPGYDTLVEIITAFPAISPTWLLTGAGPMLLAPAESPTSSLLVPEEKPKNDLTPSSLPAINGSRVLTVTVGLDGEENTALVPIHAQAGYSQQHNEAVFLQQLRQYRIPGFEWGTFRAFEVSGDSMEPTLHHHDVVIASYVGELRLLEPGEVYVVVTAENVLLKRIKDRLRATDEEVVLHSDNPQRKPFGLETRDIIELWRVRGYISTYLPSAPDITVERLWEVIEQLGFDKGEVRRHLENIPADSAHSL